MRYERRTFVLGLTVCLVWWSLGLYSCATSGTARHNATVSIVSAHSVLTIIDDTEMKMVCGKVTAPDPPYCVPIETHRMISEQLAKAYGIEVHVARLVRDLPANSPTPAEAARMTVQIGQIVQEILALLPQSAGKKALVEKITPESVR